MYMYVAALKQTLVSRHSKPSVTQASLSPRQAETICDPSCPASSQVAKRKSPGIILFSWTDVGPYLAQRVREIRMTVFTLRRFFVSQLDPSLVVSAVSTILDFTLHQ